MGVPDWKYTVAISIATVATISIVYCMVFGTALQGCRDRHSDEMIHMIKQRLKLLDSNLSHVPIYASTSSYIQNKRRIYLCVRDPKTKKLYDINTLMYVTLHEVAHFVSDSYSTTSAHNGEFHTNFNTILMKAKALGIYDSSKPVPTTYCGLV
uniref:WLM domain-containing protein n=1 Tax=viral metagenome TaxID=1070528 RepID=A0A6C0LZA4_9ZZZZ